MAQTRFQSSRSARGAADHPMLTGVFIGLLVGLCLALAVALYLNQSNPFVAQDRAPAHPEQSKSPPGRPDPSKPQSSKAESTKPGLVKPAPPIASMPQHGSIAGMPTPARTQPAKPQEARQADAKRFDFYKILPGTEEAVTDKDLQRPAQPGAEQDVYYLQAGAFQKAADADNLKARLALAGVEAQIQTATLPDRSVWHRVRLGPFANAEAMTQARGVLRENKIEPSIIKVAEREPKS